VDTIGNPRRAAQRTRSLILAGGAFALAIFFAGCSSGPGRGDGAERVTIYVSAPLGGPAGTDGTDIEDGARMAIADAKGEAGGIKVRAIYLNDAGAEQRFDQVTTAENARQATEDSSAVAYIGELDSAATRVSLPIINQAGILQVSPGSGASDLVRADLFNDDVPTELQTTGKRTFARLVPSDEQLGAVAAGVLLDAPGSSSLIISDGSPFAGELISGFKEKAPAARVIPVAHGGEVSNVDPDRDPVSLCDLALKSVETLRRARLIGRPVADPRVFIATEPECAVKVLAAMRADRISASIVGTDALLDPKAQATLRAAGGGQLVTATYSTDLLPADGKTFAGQFLVRYDRPAGPYAAYGYEAMASVLAAIDRSDDPSDRDSVIDAYFDGTHRNSVIGPYSIDGIGETSQAWLSVLRLKPNGATETNAVKAP
jgi:branched-chain amino acid transport system substrate-binding protein